MFRILFLLWSCSLLAVSVSWGQAGKIDSTYKALIALYDSTNGDQWDYSGGTRSGGWLQWNTETVPSSMEDFNQWLGLTVEGGNLIAIDLRNRGLNGNIPPELGDLSSLQVLMLHDNQITGEIPAELGKLSSLELLTLDNNQLTGEIPAELGNLSNLQGLSLHYNQLTGEIPAELGKLSSLKTLYLYENQLTGEIPPELGNLSNLAWLDLNNNQLTGSIPAELGNLSNLETLRLDGIDYRAENMSLPRLTGEIPAELGKLSSLKTLYLSSNQLTGEIPTELGNLSNLKELYLYENQLTGRIPHSFLQLNLRYLGLPYSVCVPDEDEFWGWRDEIENVGSIVYVHCVTLVGKGDITNQSYPRAQTIPVLSLPHATGGRHGFTYTLTPDELPQGLRFDGYFRNISGTPTEVTPPVMFTYTATDIYGNSDSLQFSIEVYSPVSTEQYDPLPTEFAVLSNYPNPFRYSTSIRLDLPWPARVGVKVLDITGRQVFMQSPIDLLAGGKQEVTLPGLSLSSGVYLYHLTADSAEGRYVHVGHFVRIR